jgi:hypothetical protein
MSQDRRREGKKFLNSSKHFFLLLRERNHSLFFILLSPTNARIVCRCSRTTHGGPYIQNVCSVIEPVRAHVMTAGHIFVPGGYSPRSSARVALSNSWAWSVTMPCGLFRSTILNSRCCVLHTKQDFSLWRNSDWSGTAQRRTFLLVNRR